MRIRFYEWCFSIRQNIFSDQVAATRNDRQPAPTTVVDRAESRRARCHRHDLHFTLILRTINDRSSQSNLPQMWPAPSPSFTDPNSGPDPTIVSMDATQVSFEATSVPSSGGHFEVDFSSRLLQRQHAIEIHSSNLSGNEDPPTPQAKRSRLAVPITEGYPLSIQVKSFSCLHQYRSCISLTLDVATNDFFRMNTE